jgi:hypothetical protein
VRESLFAVAGLCEHVLTQIARPTADAASMEQDLARSFGQFIAAALQIQRDTAPKRLH